MVADLLLDLLESKWIDKIEQNLYEFREWNEQMQFQNQGRGGGG